MILIQMCQHKKHIVVHFLNFFTLIREIVEMHCVLFVKYVSLSEMFSAKLYIIVPYYFIYRQIQLSVISTRIATPIHLTV